jgi:hypothetical protein
MASWVIGKSVLKDFINIIFIYLFLKIFFGRLVFIGNVPPIDFFLN